mmetsp:Transcript_28713/g.56266  ORF Transcript_28713/g.56266 Transcript_28713/m.56266 type:complete len:110 (-) Transcript_28713:1033-1362(-)
MKSMHAVCRTDLQTPTLTQPGSVGLCQCSLTYSLFSLHLSLSRTHARTHTHTHTHTDVHKQTDAPTYREKKKKTGRQKDRQTEKSSNKQTIHMHVTPTAFLPSRVSACT